MDAEIIKKMNEVIGLLKVIERELASYGTYEQRKHIAEQRTPDILMKYRELNDLIATKGPDEIANKLHKQLTEEISKVLEVKEPMKESKYF